jgi:hypothetical protein
MCVDCVLASPRIAQVDPVDGPLLEVVLSQEFLPLMVGWDYNIIRNPSEKNNDRFSARWHALFNAFI